MKSFVITLKFLLLPLVSILTVMNTFAQRLPLLSYADSITIEQISFANPFVGAAKLSYNFDNDKPLNDNILFSAHGQINIIESERYVIPVVGLAGLAGKDPITPSAGISIGLYPYYILSQKNLVVVILHGGVAYKIVTATNDEPKQTKILAGIEIIKNTPGKLPITLSLTPAYLFHPDDISLPVLEISAVIPVVESFGILLEGVTPLKNNHKGQIRIAALKIIN